MTTQQDGPTSNPHVAFRGVGKSFFGVSVLRDITFDVGRAEIVGLIGENGAGKSTLMNILGGVLPADEGEVRIDGDLHEPNSPVDAAASGIAFIHQELNLFGNLSVAENLFIDRMPTIGRSPVLDRRLMRREARRLLGLVGLELDTDTLVEDLSLGERQLVEIARALGTRAQVLIFDEPTTSLTARESSRLFQLIRRLREDGTTVIYISHALADVANLCDRVVVLRDGRVVAVRKVEGLDVPGMIGLMVGRVIDHLYPEALPTPGTEPLLELRGVSQRGVVENVDLLVRRGEIVGLFGLMGSGRTELMRIIFGADPFEQGEIIVAGRHLRNHSPRAAIEAGCAFVTENRREEGLFMDLSVVENVTVSALEDFRGRVSRLLDERQVTDAAACNRDRLRIKAEQPTRQAVKTLSGGNQQKVVIGRWLLARPTVFIMDEPTRGVDVGAKSEIYRIIASLAEGGSAVLVVSSELEELTGLCHRIAVMAVGEVTATFSEGDFDESAILSAAFQHTVGAQA